MKKSKFWKYIDKKGLGKAKYLIDFTKVNYESFSLTKESEIIASITNIYNIGYNEIYKKSRLRKYCEPRHMAMFLMKEILGLRICKIAEKFSCHHSTVLYGCKNIEILIATNIRVWRKYSFINVKKPYIEPKNPRIKKELGKD